MIHQRGGALVEFSILCLVMIPLFFAIPMIGKLIDLKQTTIQASRYSAWEATVYPSGSNQNQPTAVKERFFGANLFEDDEGVLVSHSTEPGFNSLWGDEGSIQQRGWWGKTDIKINEQIAPAAAYAGGIDSNGIGYEVGNLVSSAGELLDGVSGNEWGLEGNGYVRADINVEVQENDWLARQDGACGSENSYACINASSVIMSDGWSSSGDEQAKRRVRSLTPASLLEPIGDTVSLLGHLPVMKELRGLKDAFGHVDMNVLPPYEPTP